LTTWRRTLQAELFAEPDPRDPERPVRCSPTWQLRQLLTDRLPTILGASFKLRTTVPPARVYRSSSQTSQRAQRSKQPAASQHHSNGHPWVQVPPTHLLLLPGSANFNRHGPDNSSSSRYCRPARPRASHQCAGAIVAGQPVTVNFTVQSSTRWPRHADRIRGVVTASPSCTGRSCRIGRLLARLDLHRSRTLTATYQPSPGSNFASSTSATVAHQVYQADTTTSILSDLPDPSWLDNRSR